MDKKKVKNILEKIDELNLIVPLSYYKAKKETRVEEITDDFLSMLIDAYLLGYLDNNPDKEVDLVKLNQSVYKKFDDETFEDRVKTHVENEDVPALQKLLMSEWHRDYNQGAYDGAIEGQYTMKTWVTMRDERVRYTHEFLEGVQIPVTEEFHTNDGDHARFPGDFENPANNVNCRCILEYT